MFTVVPVLLSVFTTILYQLNFVVKGFSAAYLTGKMLCASVFLVTALLAIILNKQRSRFSYLVCAAVFCGFTGDLLLALSVGGSEIFFLVGMGFFAVNFILLTVAFFTVDRFRIRDAVGNIIILGLTLAYVLLGKAELGNMLVPMLVYAAIASLAVCKSFSVLHSGKIDSEAGRLLTLGVSLFFISDILLVTNGYMNLPAIIRSISPSLSLGSNPGVLLDIANSFTYFIGQTLIASSLFYIRGKKQ